MTDNYFVCDDCGSENTKQSLRHRNGVAGKGQYECRDCGSRWWA